jgi:hypothetical protein
LFFECRFARRVWGVIFLAFGIPPPSSVSNMFGSWLEGFEHNLRNIILLGAASTCWVLWLSRNYIVFEKKINLLSFAGDLCHFPLAPYVGGATEAGATGYDCGGYDNCWCMLMWSRTFIPRSMGGDLVIRLIATRVSVVF